MKKILTYAGIVLFFLVLTYTYMSPQLEGKIVDQSDISGFHGMAHEMATWNGEHPDDQTLWTGAMFSGMPTITIINSPKGDLTQWIHTLLLKGKRPACYLFLALLGGFLMLLAAGVNPLLAAGGAVAVAFCSYNFQIIQVGHNSKMQAIAFAPWVMAALIYTYKSARSAPNGKWRDWLPKCLLGAVLFALSLSMELKANHQQITYYLALVIVIFAVAEFISVLRGKRDGQPLKGPLTRFFSASALLLFFGLVGIATNANRLLPLYEYQKHTMRGGSELTAQNGGDVNSEGLSIDYATQWSYGWEELPNTLIANFNGGSSSQAVNPDKSATVKLLKSAGQTNARQVAKALPMYWGPQPFTAGPMYMGAITVFLFVLGLLVWRGREKWWMLAAVLLSVFLSLGDHFMAFTKFFFYHVPLYSKFRTVSMSLVALQWLLPLLGFMTLDRILKGGYNRRKVLKSSYIALAVTAGFCFLAWLIPSIAGDFTAPTDAGQQAILVDAFREDRKMLLRGDALCSGLLIVASWLLLVWGLQEKKGGSDNRRWAAAGICLLILVNLWWTGKRYLNDDCFVTPRNFTAQFDKRPVDEQILADPSPSYRVIDLTANIFNDSHASYWHKNIGGYSAAKLQSYQDLIDRYLTAEINGWIGAAQNAGTVGGFEEAMPYAPILSALNTKYVILGANLPPAVNSKAFGNAWFVSETVTVAGPDEEIAAIGDIDLHTTAVLREEYADAAKGLNSGDSTAIGIIEMTSYAPNELNYRYNATREGFAVFSEVWYANGWKAWLDGDPSQVVDLVRTDWIMRGAKLPEGEHTLTMRYEPEIAVSSENMSRASSVLLIALTLLLLGGGAVLTVSKQKGEAGEKRP